MMAWYIFSVVMIRQAILMTWNSAISRQAWSARTRKVKRQLWVKSWRILLVRAMVPQKDNHTAIWSMVVLFSVKRLIRSKPLCLVRWVRVDAVRMRWILVQWLTVFVVVVGIRLYLCLKLQKALAISWVIPLVRHKSAVFPSSAILLRLIWNRMCVMRAFWPAVIVLKTWIVRIMTRLYMSMIWQGKRQGRKILALMFLFLKKPASSCAEFLFTMAKGASLPPLW